MKTFTLIPDNLVEQTNLTPSEIYIIAKIYGFENNKQECYISNDTFATWIKLSKRQTSRIINSLSKDGWIYIELEKTSKNNDKRKLFITDKTKQLINGEQTTPIKTVVQPILKPVEELKPIKPIEVKPEPIKVDQRTIEPDYEEDEIIKIEDLFDDEEDEEEEVEIPTEELLDIIVKNMLNEGKKNIEIFGYLFNNVPEVFNGKNYNEAGNWFYNDYLKNKTTKELAAV